MPRVLIAANRPYAELLTEAQGFIAENYTRPAAPNSGAPTSQVIYAAGLWIPSGKTITNVHVDLATLAVGTTPTLIKGALLDKTGKVLNQSANIATDGMWTATAGLKTIPLGGTVSTTSSDLYYVAFLKNGAFGSTDLQLMRRALAGGQATGTGTALWGQQTGQTDFAANASSQTLTTGTTVVHWVAVS